LITNKNIHMNSEISEPYIFNQPYGNLGAYPWGILGACQPVRARSRCSPSKRGTCLQGPSTLRDVLLHNFI
jgi:hypothetical protein